MTSQIENPPLDLSQSSAKLRTLADSFADRENSLVTAQELAGLRLELNRARHILQRSGADLSFREEQLECRRNLERLQSILTEISARLLLEQARLDRDRAHFQAAACWRQSSRELLR